MAEENKYLLFKDKVLQYITNHKKIIMSDRFSTSMPLLSLWWKMESDLNLLKGRSFSEYCLTININKYIVADRGFVGENITAKEWSRDKLKVVLDFGFFCIAELLSSTCRDFYMQAELQEKIDALEKYREEYQKYADEFNSLNATEPNSPDDEDNDVMMTPQPS